MANGDPVPYNHKAYLRGGYTVGRYASEDEIMEAIAGGKVFVFRQSLGYRLVGWVFLIAGALVLGDVLYEMATSWSWTGDITSYIRVAALIGLFWVVSLWGFLSARDQFVVVGARGIIWRTRHGVRALPWGQVASVKTWITDTFMYSNPGAVAGQNWSARIDTGAGQQYKISPRYRNREFPRARGWEFMAKTVTLCWEYYNH